MKKFKVEVITRLIDLTFTKSSVNALQLIGVLKRASEKMYLNLTDAELVITDGSSVNENAMKFINRDLIKPLF